MLFCSLLANTSTLEVFEYVLQNFFTILLFQLETEILQKSHATSFSDAENMTDLKTLLKFENEEQVREFLENEKNGKRWRPNRNKFNERWPPKAQNYYETDEEVNKRGKKQGKVTQKLDNDFEETWKL